MRHYCTQMGIAALLLLFALPSFAQHDDGQAEAQGHNQKIINRHSIFPHLRAAAFISHTFIPGVAEGSRFAIPSYGLDIEYWFDETWGVGLHNDIELESFIIEGEQEEFLERDFPLVSSLDLLFKPWKGLAFQIGPGVEIDKHETFLLFRLGVEYEIELGHHWDLYPTFFYDTREDSYTTFSIGLGVGKRF
ncbi:porin family protein [Phaeodactylibacter luteus]|uniref:Porin family protein n=1 Tax=Phaeodactylibacter luteus TaxID=1564516 RepID=A0A5C6S4X1_9BACT|nr:porin family protein [Phaeodactylibacter luteus]TXB69469.1 porin family protein [Phaeodactylibacter luteus]